MNYIKNLLISIDQLFNTICGGWPDETLSSRCYRLAASGRCRWPEKIINTILFFDKNHCFESFVSERAGRQLPPEARPKTGD